MDLGSSGFLPTSLRDGSRRWVRVTIDPLAGEQHFWMSPEGRVWSEIGDVRRFEPFATLHDSRGPVFVGGDRAGTDNPFAGELFYLEVRSGIDGPVIANLDFRTLEQRNDSDGLWIDDFGNVFEGVGNTWEYVQPEG